MTAITRRSFLQQAPVAAVVAAAPVSLAVAETRPAIVENPELEIFRLARELHAKVTAHYGGKWQFIHNQASGAMFFVPAPPPPRIVEFAGPGWYEVESRGPELPTRELFIEVHHKLPPHPKDGRWFVARSNEPDYPGPVFYQESWLRQIIVRKIGGAA